MIEAIRNYCEDDPMGAVLMISVGFLISVGIACVGFWNLVG